MTYLERKAERIADSHRNAGRRLIECTACSGSGRYDHNGSPKCGQCQGTGKMRNEAPPVVPTPTTLDWREQLKMKDRVRKFKQNV